MPKPSDFNRDVALPAGLTLAAISKSIEYVERQASELVDIYLEQQNVFSAVVGIYAAKGLDTHSIYEKHKHTSLAQTRFPDLKRRGASEPLRPEDCLESKASKRPWALQAHYDHAGWYIVWRYMVDPTETIEPGQTVIIWRVDIAFLTRDDWKYEASSAGKEGGGRTHTYGLKRPFQRLKDLAAYSRSDIVLRSSKPTLRNGNV